MAKKTGLNIFSSFSSCIIPPFLSQTLTVSLSLNIDRLSPSVTVQVLSFIVPKSLKRSSIANGKHLIKMSYNFSLNVLFST
jgi:hypothetical protein